MQNRKILRAAGVLATGVLATALATAPGASAAGYGTGRPLAAIARAAGTANVYWRGSDGFLWEKSESGGVWGAPTRTPIGGLASDPAAVIGSHLYDYVFWEGTDGNLWEAANAPGGWIGPTKIAAGPFGSDPTAASITTSTTASEIDVFWKAAGPGLIRTKYTPATGWSAPGSVFAGGTLGTAPAATEEQTSGGVQIQVYWMGDPSNLWEASSANGSSTWTQTDLGMEPVGSAPTAGTLGFGREIVFWAGTNSLLIQGDWISTPWTGAQLTGPTGDKIGPLGSAPTVTPQGTDAWDVFYLGTNGDLWEAVSSGAAGFTSNQDLGPLTPAAPAAPAASTPAPAPAPAAPGNTTVTIKPKRPHHVNANLTVEWHWNHARTRLRSLKFSHMPKHAVIRVSCTGKHCPWQSIAVKKRERGSLISTLKHHAFRAGQTLTIKISSRGLRPERIRIQFRNGRKPRAKLLS